MNGGWFKIYRSLLDSDIWLEKPFGKGQAFVDLIGHANYADSEEDVQGKKFIVHRGELFKSQRDLSFRWGWDRTKVRLFLKYLEDNDMISMVTENNITIIKIVNYEKYQASNTMLQFEEGPKLLPIEPKPAGQDELKVRDSICKYFGFNELRHTTNFMAATKFVMCLKERGQLEHFITQFEAYKEYMEALKFSPAGFSNFIGNQYEFYENGKWNAENWTQKLEKHRTNDNSKSKTTESNSRYSVGAQNYKGAKL